MTTAQAETLGDGTDEFVLKWHSQSTRLLLLQNLNSKSQSTLWNLSRLKSSARSRR